MSNKIATEREAAAMNGITLDSNRGCTKAKANELGLTVGGLPFTEQQLVPEDFMMAEPIPILCNPDIWFKSAAAFSFTYLDATCRFGYSDGTGMDEDWTSYLYNTLGDSGNLPQTNSNYDFKRYTKQNRWYIGSGLIFVPAKYDFEISFAVALNQSTPKGKARSNSMPQIIISVRDKLSYVGIYSDLVENTVSESTYGFTRTVKIPMSVKCIEDPMDESILLSLAEFYNKYKEDSGDTIQFNFNCDINFITG